MGKPQGLTLIELCAIIGVITLLTAPLIPVLRSAREQGRRMVCPSNLRQLTLATEDVLRLRVPWRHYIFIILSERAD